MQFFTSVWCPSGCHGYSRLRECPGPGGRGSLASLLLRHCRQPSGSGCEGRQEDLWPVPCTPWKRRAGGTRCKTEKQKEIRLLFFLGPCHTLPSAVLPPGASWRGAPEYLSRRYKKARLAVPGLTDGRRGKAEPARRGMQDRPGGPGRGEGGEAGTGLLASSPVSLSPWCPTLQTGYQPPGGCQRFCPHSVMHGLCKVKRLLVHHGVRPV